MTYEQSVVAYCSGGVCAAIVTKLLAFFVICLEKAGTWHEVFGCLHL